MSHRHRTRLTIAVVALTLGCVAGAPAAQAENWQFRSDLGGWLDVETGLVWGAPSQNWINAYFQWDAAALAGIPMYREMTGNPRWRLPTVQEFQTAASHNAWIYFSQTSNWSGPWWTATAGTGKDKKSAWAMMSIRSGATRLYAKTTRMGLVPVYRP